MEKEVVELYRNKLVCIRTMTGLKFFGTVIHLNENNVTLCDERKGCITVRLENIDEICEKQEVHYNE